MHAHDPPGFEEQRQPATRRPGEADASTHAPGRLAVGTMAGLQRAVGNAAVVRLIESQRRRAGHAIAEDTVEADAGRPVAGPLVHEAGRLAVQRNVGVELEDSHWRVTEKDHRVDKGKPIVHRPLFQLQAEDNADDISCIELVTNPPGTVSRDEWNAMATGMKELSAELVARTNGPSFSAAQLAGGDQRYVLHPGFTFSPHLQVTAGVPLASVPALFAKLDRLAVRTVPDVGFVRATTSRLRGQQQEPDSGPGSKEEKKTETEPGSSKPEGGPEQVERSDLAGLIILIRSYLLEGVAPPEEKMKTATMLKGITKVMARTDFAAMFMLLPEEDRQAINQDRDGWVEAMTQGLTDGGKAPVFEQVAYDPGQGGKDPNPDDFTDPMRLTTTRGEWLTEMTSTGQGKDEQRGRDVLTIEGKLAGPDPRAEDGGSEIRRQARKLAVGVTEARGQAKEQSTLTPDSFSPVADRIARTGEGLADLERILSELKDLHEGFGRLGATVDSIQYEGEEAATPAVIVEIRSPVAANWSIAEGIYNAIDGAISNDGKRPYQSIISAHGQKQRDELENQRKVAVENQEAAVENQPRQQTGVLRQIGKKLKAAYRFLKSLWSR